MGLDYDIPLPLCFCKTDRCLWHLTINLKRIVGLNNLVKATLFIKKPRHEAAETLALQILVSPNGLRLGQHMPPV